jgi:hypothetical protein
MNDKEIYVNKAGGGSTPDQYEVPKDSKDLQDLIEFRKMDFATGNIFKACYRIGFKNDPMYEINKILWFANRLKKYYETQNKDQS